MLRTTAEHREILLPRFDVLRALSQYTRSDKWNLFVLDIVFSTFVCLRRNPFIYTLIANANLRFTPSIVFSQPIIFIWSSFIIQNMFSHSAMAWGQDTHTSKNKTQKKNKENKRKDYSTQGFSKSCNWNEYNLNPLTSIREPGFKSRSSHKLGLFWGCSWFNFSAALVNSQLVCLPPVGILNLFIFI